MAVLKQMEKYLALLRTLGPAAPAVFAGFCQAGSPYLPTGDPYLLRVPVFTPAIPAFPPAFCRVCCPHTLAFVVPLRAQISNTRLF